MVMLIVTKCEKDIRLGDFVSTWKDRGRIQNDFGKLEKCLEISTRKFNTDKWKTQALEQQNQMPRHREVSNSLWVSIIGKEMTTKWIGANTIGWAVPKEENATLCCVHRMLDKLLVSVEHFYWQPQHKKAAPHSWKGDKDRLTDCCQKNSKKY